MLGSRVSNAVSKLFSRLQQFGRGTLYGSLGLILAILAVFELGWWHALDTLDNRVGDVLLRWHAQDRPPPADVVLVDIDQPSLMQPEMLQVAGTWSWPRVIHAELIQALAAHEPRAIVVDLILSPPDSLRPGNDQALAQAVAFERVFVPMVLLEDSEQQAPLKLAPPIMGIRPLAGANPDARYGIDAPVALPPERWRTGYINFNKDDDGRGRHLELWREVQGWRLPHIVDRVAQLLHWPEPQQPRFRLHWYGQEFTRIPYAKVYLASQSEGQKLPFDPRGKVIVIGSTASGLLDFVPTPMDATTPGPFVVATALANLQAGDWLRDAPSWLNPTLALLLIAGLGSAFLQRRSPVVTAVGFGVVAILVLGIVVLLLRQQVYWMPVSALSLGALALLSFGLLSSRLEMAQRHHVQEMFARFVDPRIVNNLSEGDHEAHAEVTASRMVTVLFSDIRGFTSLSERRTPEEIVGLLNRYFEMQVEVLFRHQGTLDKFIGDAIMAFWGAPIAQANHAELAVRAALDMSKALDRFAADMALESPGTKFDIGIGVHSGPAVVGFLGTSKRLDYTAIGDTVNLSSRIEGSTKGVARILVSETTKQLCENVFEFVDHGDFHVKGREQAVRLYEPVRIIEAAPLGLPG